MNMKNILYGNYFSQNYFFGNSYKRFLPITSTLVFDVVDDDGSFNDPDCCDVNAVFDAVN
jgi:hypothetical protein